MQRFSYRKIPGMFCQMRSEGDVEGRRNGDRTYIAAVYLYESQCFGKIFFLFARETYPERDVHENPRIESVAYYSFGIFNEETPSQAVKDALGPAHHAHVEVSAASQFHF